MRHNIYLAALLALTMQPCVALAATADATTGATYAVATPKMQPYVPTEENLKSREEFQDAKNRDVHDIQFHLLGNDVHRRLMQKIDDSMRVLNDDGKQEAVKRVEELTEIPKYQLHHDPDEK